MLMSEEMKMIKALNRTINELRDELQQKQREIEALTIDVKVLQDEVARSHKQRVDQR
jgi:uncharacterized coiled-coil protein SlyX